MVVEEEEKILLQETVKASKELGWGKGTLTLTNRRVFFKRPRGLLSKKEETLLNLPLNGISNTNIDHSNHLEVEGREHPGGFLLIGRFEVKDPGKWITKIKSARTE